MKEKNHDSMRWWIVTRVVEEKHSIQARTRTEAKDGVAGTGDPCEIRIKSETAVLDKREVSNPKS